MTVSLPTALSDHPSDAISQNFSVYISKRFYPDSHLVADQPMTAVSNKVSCTMILQQ